MPEPRTVVIADDDPAVLELIQEAFSLEEELVIVAATDGAEAWRAIRAHRPAAVVLDVEMPGRTGLELAQAIKADASLAGRR